MISAAEKISMRGWRKLAAPLLPCLLSACQLVQFQPTATLNRIDLAQGYRLQKEMAQQNTKDSDVFAVVLFSGGGTRAAALGYGVLEQLDRQPVWINGKQTTLFDNIDLVYGVSGGSVLAAYYALHGQETIPSFEKRFLKQNLQRLMTKQVFSAANLPRLTSAEFGRSDLLQEQLESTLFGKATFGDLNKRRQGPFAVISATDMSLGNRIDFTQEYFDAMCLNLSDLRIARAVAASSSVPLVFSPITLNNNGGHCGYVLPSRIQQSLVGSNAQNLQTANHREFAQNLQEYTDSARRPYIHLLDGGMTDNLGLRSLLDTTQIYPNDLLYQQFSGGKVRKIVVISVNARNHMASEIDRSPAVPGVRDVASAIINIPIDQYSQESLRSFRTFADKWNNEAANNPQGHHVGLYFVSLNLQDLPESPLRQRVLNIPTSFYLPSGEINDLKEAARLLMANSSEYKRLMQDLSAPAVEAQPAVAREGEGTGKQAMVQLYPGKASAAGYGWH